MASNEEEQHKLEEIRRRAEEAEARRIEEEVTRQTEALLKLRGKKAAPSQMDEELRSREEEKAKREAEERAKREEEALIEKTMQEGGKRKLAAIMFTDIKGFSKKMGESETGPMEVLRIHNTMMENIISKHSGNVIKSIGDSFMVDFPSAVNATKCAIELQESFWKYNQGKTEFDEIQIRIGIHLGDVITVGKDMFGDGVNIASRIEAITEPSRICISQDMYNQVRNKLNLRAVSAGFVKLKNIAEPVEVYQVLIDSIPELAKPSTLVQEALDQRQQEELAKKELKETEQKKKTEEEQHKQREEEEQKRREEEERRQKEEEDRQRRSEEERRRREEEDKRRQEEMTRKRSEEEERLRVDNALSNAGTYFEQKNFEEALAEIEKLLSVNPLHAEALALDETIRKARAEFEAEQQRAAEQAAEAEAKALAEAPPQPSVEIPVVEKKAEKLPTPKKGIPKRIVMGAIAVVIIVIAGIVVFRLSHSLLQGKRSIAIVSFTSQTNSEDERLIGTALAQEIGTALGRFPDMRVMGASSAASVTRISKDPRTQASKLNFAYTFGGTILFTGSTITLNVILTDTAGNQLWTSSVEKPRNKLFEIPDELIGGLTAALDVSTSNEKNAVPNTTNESAYLAYLRGRAMLYQGTYVAYSNAMNQFRNAMSQDPNFAEAYAAAAYTLFRIFESGMSTDEESLVQAKELATKAVRERQPLAEAHMVLGGINQLQKKYRESAAELETAISQIPSNSEAHRLSGILFAIGGNEDKSLEQLRLAYELDPLNIDVLTSLGLVFQRFGNAKEAMTFFDRALPLISDTSTYLSDVAGNTLVSAYQYDRAISLYERRVTANPSNFIDQYRLARAYQLNAKDASKAFEKAIAIIQEKLQLNPQNVLATAYLGLVYSRYGRFREGEANGKKAMQLAPNNPTIKYKLAEIYSIQKKKDEAIKALQVALASRYPLSGIERDLI